MRGTKEISNHWWLFVLLAAIAGCGGPQRKEGGKRLTPISTGDAPLDELGIDFKMEPGDEPEPPQEDERPPIVEVDDSDCGATAIKHALSDIIILDNGTKLKIADLVAKGRMTGNPHILDYVFALFLQIKLEGTKLEKCTVHQEVKVYLRTYQGGKWVVQSDDKAFKPDTGIGPKGDVPVGSDGVARKADGSRELIDAYNFGSKKDSIPFVAFAEIHTYVKEKPSVETTTLVFFSSKGVATKDPGAGTDKDDTRKKLRARVDSGELKDGEKPDHSESLNK